MNLVEHYDRLYKESILKIKSDHCQTDPLIDAAFDTRLGLTLIMEPDRQVKKNIQSFLSDLKAIEPEQYYYPDSDIHVTVLAIISCYEGFDLNRIAIPDYVAMIKKSITSQKGIETEFRGITASPSCVLIQGFLSDNTLNDIRDNLRVNFKGSGLKHTIDQRYAIQTAHSTVVRFRKELTRKDDFMKVLEDYRECDFGTCSINTIELVCNDWYHRKAFERKICGFELN